MREKELRQIFHWHGRGLFRKDRLPVRVIHVVEKKARHPVHDHDFLEIVLVLNGTAYHQTSGEASGELTRGDVLIIRPGTTHTYRRCDDFYYINCVIGVELLERELAWFRQVPELDYLLWSGPMGVETRGVVRLKFDEPIISECEHRLKGLIKTLEGPSESNHLMIISELLALFSRLVGAMGSTHRDISAMPHRKHVSVRRAIELMEADLAGEWTLSSLAEKIHVDRYHLSRLFKAATGQPPMAYLSRLRGNHAAKLLLQTDLPLSEVAIQSGWPEPSKFSSRFRLQFGNNPSAYRESLRKS